LLEGMYSAAAGMEAQQQRMDVLSNDMANVNTTGYKSMRVAFRDLLYTQSGKGAAQGVTSGAGAAVTTLGRVNTQGAIQQTGRTLDFAIQGNGYLQVRDPQNGTVLTRDGSLQRRADGQLTTSNGQLVGIRVPSNVDESQITIGSDGRVFAASRQVGRLNIVNVRAPEGLQPLGDNNFRATATSGPARPLTGTQLQTGSLEESNVNMGDVMIDLMDAQRSYELVSKAISTQDQMLDIANQVKHS
jgi:flagellar basal-body rod protein FlgG